MITIEKFKQLLGSEAQNLTDKEIEEIRDSQYQLADIVFDMWWEDKKENKKKENTITLIEPIFPLYF